MTRVNETANGVIRDDFSSTFGTNHRAPVLVPSMTAYASIKSERNLCIRFRGLLETAVKLLSPVVDPIV